MLWFRHLLPFAVIAGLATAALAGFHAWNKGFNENARRKLTEELAKQDLHADVGKLSLDPLRGLVARKFRLYGGPKKDMVLATFDELRLDVDVSRYLQKQQFINSLELDRANLSLPFDPTDPKAGSVKLTNVNARIVASGDRFEIRRAEGDFYGTRVTLSGSLLRPVKDKRPKNGAKPDNDARAPLEFVQQRREAIQGILKYVQKLRAQDLNRPARLELRVEGDLDHPQELRAWARLHGEKLRYGGFRIAALDASAEYQNGELYLKDASLRDGVGRLTMRGHWSRKEDAMPFSVASTINLPALIGEITADPRLREVVFYQPEAMKFEADGTFTPSDAAAGRAMSVRALGTFAAGRFNTRGVVFEGAGGSFFVQGSDMFLREFRLRHASGTVTGEALKQGDHLRYRTNFRMNPGVFAPFITQDVVRQWLGRLEAGPSSLVQLTAAGEGLLTDAHAWQHTADVDLREIEFDGEAVRRCEFHAERKGPVSVLTGIRLVRPEGVALAKRLTMHDTEVTFDFEDVESTVQPVPVIRWFAPVFVKVLEPYVFATPPSVKMSGFLAPNDPARTDLDFAIQSAGNATVPLAGAPLTIAQPVASLSIKSQRLQVDVTAKASAGTAWRDATLRDAAELRFLGAWQFDHGNVADSAWQLFLNGNPSADYKLGRQTVSLTKVKGAFDYRKRPGFPNVMLQADVKATALPGSKLFNATFRGQPDVHLTGFFDTEPAQRGDDTQWHVSIDAPEGVDYPLGEQALPFTEARLSGDYARGRIKIPGASARLFGGAVRATIDLENPGPTPDIAASISADGVSLAQLAHLYSPSTETGGQLSGTFAVAGSTAESGRLRGSGKVTVKDGDIFALPLLGPLSPLLSAMLPGTKTGYSKAREATASFSLADQVLKTEDFEALTTAFVIKGAGTVHLATKHVDLDARVNTRGPTGLLLYPVSKLLEYEARGTTSDPGWRPSVLSLPGKLVPEALKPNGR